MSTTKPRKPAPRQEATSADTTAKRLKELAADPKLARLVAANSSASAELLLELSRSDDKTVRKACTSNANTPVEALLKLGSQFADQLLENPVFDLLLLAHPGVFEELPTATLNSLLKRDRVPVELIRWAWKHRGGDSTLHSLLMNPNTPADVVEELCSAKDQEIQIAAELHCSRELPGWAKDVHNNQDLAQRNPSQRSGIKFTENWLCISEAALQCIDQEQTEDLVAIAEAELRMQLASISLPHHAFKALAKYPEAQRNLAESRLCPQDLLDELAADLQPNIRNAIAKNPQTRPKTLSLLAKDPDRNVRQTAARNKATREDAIKTLAQDPGWQVREIIAGREDLSPLEIELLASDSNKHVRAAIARNLCCSVNTLEKLAGDKKWHVRSGVAQNQNSSLNTLEQLSKESDWDVLRALVDNKRTPTEAWMRAFRRMRTILDEEWERNYREGIYEIHPFAKIAISPSAPIDALKELVDEDDYQVREGIASSINASQEILAILSRDREAIVRREVALNQNTSQSVLEILAQDKDDYVRSGVATNSKASNGILARLSRDKSAEVRGAVAKSSHIPYEISKVLASDSDWWVKESLATNDAVHGHILDSLAADKSNCIRALIAGNPSTQPATLARLMEDPDPDVRAAVAINSNTPRNLLLVLASDPDILVMTALAKLKDLEKEIVDALLLNSEGSVTKTLLSNWVIPVDRARRLWCQLFADLLIAACSGSTPSPGRRFLFTLPQCPAHILAKNFRSRSWLERFAIAGNSSTPVPVLERMAKEGNQLVRRAATENLAHRVTRSDQLPSPDPFAP